MELSIRACIAPYLSGGRVSDTQSAQSHVLLTLLIPFLWSSNQRRYRELLAVTGILTAGNVGQDRAIINFKTKSPSCKHCIIIKYDPERG